MAIDRRKVLLGAGASLIAGVARADQSMLPRLASAYAEADGGFGVAVFDLERGPSWQMRLPGRGHDVTARPGAREAIVFARRPGRFALVFDTEGRRPPVRVDSEPGRHYFGHGVYAEGGRLLLSTENDIEGSRGVLGIRDATDGYRPIGAFPTAGVGPHDVALLSDGLTLVVANGGIETDPGGRDTIELASMRPSLAYVDMRSGALVELVELQSELRPLSIRHLAVGTGDTVAFGCQWEGERTEHPPLIGLHRLGEPPRLVAAPTPIHRRLRGYIGSIAVDHSGTLLTATSPKGGLAVHFELRLGRYLGATELPDVCGVTGTSHSGELLLTSGEGRAMLEHRLPDGPIEPVAQVALSIHLDNHAAAIV